MSTLCINWGNIDGLTKEAYIPLVSCETNVGYITLAYPLQNIPQTICITNISIKNPNNTINTTHHTSYQVIDAETSNNSTTLYFQHNSLTSVNKNFINNTINEYQLELYKNTNNSDYCFTKTLKGVLEEIYGDNISYIGETTNNRINIPQNTSFYANVIVNPNNYNNSIFNLDFKYNDIDWMQTIPTILVMINSITNNENIKPITFYDNQIIRTQSYPTYLITSTTPLLPKTLKIKTINKTIPKKVIISDYAITNNTSNICYGGICRLKNNLSIPPIEVYNNNNELVFSSTTIIKNLGQKIYNKIWNESHKLKIITGSKVILKPFSFIEYNNQLYFVNHIYYISKKNQSNIVIEAHSFEPFNNHILEVDYLQSSIATKSVYYYNTISRNFDNERFINYQINNNLCYKDIIVNQDKNIKLLMCANRLEITANSCIIHNSCCYTAFIMPTAYSKNIGNNQVDNDSLVLRVNNNIIGGQVKLDENQSFNLVFTPINATICQSQSFILANAYLSYNNQTPINIGINALAFTQIPYNNINNITIQNGISIQNYCLNCLGINNVNGCVKAMVLSGSVCLSSDLYFDNLVITSNSTIYTRGHIISARNLYIGCNVSIIPANDSIWYHKNYENIITASYTCSINYTCSACCCYSINHNFFNCLNAAGVKLLYIGGDIVRMWGDKVGVLSNDTDDRNLQYLTYIPNILTFTTPDTEIYYTLMPPKTYIIQGQSINSSIGCGVIGCLSITFKAVSPTPPVKIIAQNILMPTNSPANIYIHKTSNDTIGYIYLCFQATSGYGNLTATAYGQPIINVNNTYYGMPAVISIVTQKINRMFNFIRYTAPTYINNVPFYCNTVITGNIPGAPCITCLYLINTRTTNACLHSCVNTMNTVPQFIYFVKV